MNPIVTPSWLASRIQNPDVVVLDATLLPVGANPPADTRARYVARHIPGAMFFDIDELSDHSTPLPHMLPTAEVFAVSMAELGVSDDATIVVYEQEGVLSAPRAWWMLRTFGARSVYVLDGGMPAWIEAKLPTESGGVERATAKFNARLDRDAVIDFAGIEHLIAGKGQILDARSEGRFTGVSPEPRPGISSGHMPGAVSLPYTELAEDGRMKTAELLREIFKSHGVKIERPVTTTCGSGITAAVLALGLEIAGAQRVTLYDGSWAEYAGQPRAVIEKST